MALVRIARGPSTLDRIVANDVLLAITVGAIATEARPDRFDRGSAGSPTEPRPYPSPEASS
ncbi:hypothetical protein [Micromonospora sp. CPCC 206061]|uniref:hypothetical protein n=1 Tax=Micromonospora sp. CPCC 206061 TaxID=3122410 RepID=UPI002FF191D8